MDLNALTLLVEIVEAGNLSLAARKLKISRSNVSYRLKQLETQLGVQLLRRTTRRLEPTEIGLRLFQHGRTILDEVQAAQEAVASLGKSLQGTVRLSVPTGLGQMLLSPLLIAYKQQYPDICLDVRFDNRITNMVAEEVDIALRVMSTPPDNTVATRIGSVEWVVCATPAYLKAHPAVRVPSDLKQLSLVCAGVVGRSLRLTAYQASAEQTESREEVELQPSLLSENFSFLREAVLAGVGIGILPRYAVQEDLQAGRLQAVLAPYRMSIFGTGIWMLTLPNRYATMAVRSMMNYLKEEVRQALVEHSTT